jgi:hypothetical protein
MREYYYNEKNKGIGKRLRKRKRGDTSLIQESNEITIEWRAGPYPKYNAI